MVLTTEIMDRVLPDGFSDWRPRNEQAVNKAQALRARDGGEGPFSRSYFWQKCLTHRLREERNWLSLSLTGLEYSNEWLEQAVGFIEVDASIVHDEAIQQASRGTGYFFGAILYDHRDNPEKARLTSLDFGELDGMLKGIPTIRLAAADILHGPHLAGATSSCWASLRNLKNQPDHILTVKHAIAGLRKGQRVAMAGGGSSTLIEFCEGSVDAALIKPHQALTSMQSVKLDVDPAVGSDITFTGAGSNQRTGKITKTWVFPTDSSAYDAQRVHFDVAGVQGDSGALVRLAATGEAVGLYTGIKVGRSTQSGMSQAIWQATELLKIDLYE